MYIRRKVFSVYDPYYQMRLFATEAELEEAYKAGMSQAQYELYKNRPDLLAKATFGSNVEKVSGSGAGSASSKVQNVTKVQKTAGYKKYTDKIAKYKAKDDAAEKAAKKLKGEAATAYAAFIAQGLTPGQALAKARQIGKGETVKMERVAGGGSLRKDLKNLTDPFNAMKDKASAEAARDQALKDLEAEKAKTGLSAAWNKLGKGGKWGVGIGAGLLGAGAAYGGYKALSND